MSRDFMDDVFVANMPDEVVEDMDVPKPDKVKKSTLFKRTSEVMRGVPMVGPGRTLWPRFKKKFHVKKNDAGEHIFLEELNDEIVRYVSQQKIIDSILEYWERQTAWIYKAKEVVISEGLAKECTKYWAAISQSFDAEIQPVLEKDFPGFCFHRLAFNFARGDFNWEEQCPAFAELFGRISNSKAFMAWIGSLFDIKSSRQQYVWLYGDGRNGKSTLGRILARLMGSAIRFEHPPEKSDRFWTHGLLGKRLIVFGDCNNYGYPSTGQFKALTGEDHVRVEAKNQPSYSTALACKFLFFSNEKPNINGGESGKRRVIFCEASEITKEFGKNYEQILWDEVPVFIGACLKIYKELTVETNIISTDDERIEALISENEEKYEYFVRENLEIHSEDAELAKLEPLTPLQLQDKFHRCGIRNTAEQRHYIAYMDREYGIKKQRGKEEPRRWFYNGCSAKIMSEKP